MSNNQNTTTPVTTSGEKNTRVKRWAGGFERRRDNGNPHRQEMPVSLAKTDWWHGKDDGASFNKRDAEQKRLGRMFGSLSRGPDAGAEVQFWLVGEESSVEFFDTAYRDQGNITTTAVHLSRRTARALFKRLGEVLAADW